MLLVSVQSSVRELLLARSDEPFWIAYRSLEDSEQQTVVEYYAFPSSDRPRTALRTSEPQKNSLIVSVSLTEQFVLEITLSNGRVAHIRLPKKCVPLASPREGPSEGPRRYTALSVSRSQNAALVADSKGLVTVHLLASFEVLAAIQASDADIDVVHFFPLGRVFFSGGLDMQLRVHDIVSGTLGRTFVGHTKNVTGAAAIGPHGRNVVLVSSDGLLRLWECGSGKCLKTLRRALKQAPITSLDVLQVPSLVSAYQDLPEHDLEFGTKGMVAYTGHENGLVTSWDIYKGGQIRSYEVGSSVWCLCVFDERHVICGITGRIVVLDTVKAQVVAKLEVNQPCKVNWVQKMGSKIVFGAGNDAVMALEFEDLVKGLVDEGLVEYYSGMGDYSGTQLGWADQEGLVCINEDDNTLICY